MRVSQRRIQPNTQTKSPKGENRRFIHSRIVDHALHIAQGENESFPEFAKFPTMGEFSDFTLKPSRRDSDSIFDSQKQSRRDSELTLETAAISLESFESPDYQKNWMSPPGKNVNGRQKNWPTFQELQSPSTNPRLVLSNSSHTRKISPMKGSYLKDNRNPALRRRSLRAGKIESPNASSSSIQKTTGAQIIQWGVEPNVPFQFTAQEESDNVQKMDKPTASRAKDGLSISMHSRRSRGRRQSIGSGSRSSSQTSSRRRRSLSSRPKGDGVSPSKTEESSLRKGRRVRASISPNPKEGSKRLQQSLHGNEKTDDTPIAPVDVELTSTGDQPQHEDPPKKPKRRASITEQLQIAGTRNRRLSGWELREKAKSNRQVSGKTGLDTAWKETRSERQSRTSLLFTTSAWKETSSERQTRSTVKSFSSESEINSRVNDPSAQLPPAFQLLNKQPRNIEKQKWKSRGEATPLKCADSPNRVSSVPKLARLSNRERIRRSKESSARREDIFDSLEKMSGSINDLGLETISHSKDKNTTGFSGDGWSPEIGKSGMLTVGLEDCLEW